METKVKYASVNGAWPPGLPKITNQEAINLVRKLYRKFMGRKMPVPIRIATGNRSCSGGSSCAGDEQQQEHEPRESHDSAAVV